MKHAILQLPRTVFGEGAIAVLQRELQLLGLSRPLVVTDRGIVAAGLLDRLAVALAGLDHRIFDGVTENNVFDDVDAGSKAYCAGACDCVVGFGGGSVLDTAKCIAVVVASGEDIASFALHPDREIGCAAPVIAIPTTAGTGSDADIYAGVHPDSRSAGVGIASYQIMPKLTLLAPELTSTLPPRITAATGIDALSHCIEGFLSRDDVPFAKLIALDGLRRGVSALRMAMKDPGDLGARSEMLLASYAGGVAMSMGTGPAHALALTCSDQGFPHGILSGIGVVMTVDQVLGNRHADKSLLCAAFGISPDDSLGDAFAGLMQEVGLPTSLGGLGYRSVDVPGLASAAHAHFLNSFAHNPPSRDDYERMLYSSLAMAG
jgi:hypothetical protein